MQRIMGIPVTQPDKGADVTAGDDFPAKSYGATDDGATSSGYSAQPNGYQPTEQPPPYDANADPPPNAENVYTNPNYEEPSK